MDDLITAGTRTAAPAPPVTPGRAPTGAELDARAAALRAQNDGTFRSTNLTKTVELDELRSKAATATAAVAEAERQIADQTQARDAARAAIADHQVQADALAKDGRFAEAEERREAKADQTTALEVAERRIERSTADLQRRRPEAEAATKAVDQALEAGGAFVGRSEAAEAAIDALELKARHVHQAETRAELAADLRTQAAESRANGTEQAAVALEAEAAKEEQESVTERSAADAVTIDEAALAAAGLPAELPTPTPAPPGIVDPFAEAATAPPAADAIDGADLGPGGDGAQSVVTGDAQGDAPGAAEEPVDPLSAPMEEPAVAAAELQDDAVAPTLMDDPGDFAPPDPSVETDATLDAAEGGDGELDGFA